MRLIDADELRRRMYHEAFETDSELQKWDGGCWIRYKMFENIIESSEAIDAVPVKRGEWIQTDKAPYEYECSECGYGFTDVKLSYCYDCGAKMDGKEREDESKL